MAEARVARGLPFSPRVPRRVCLTTGHVAMHYLDAAFRTRFACDGQSLTAVQHTSYTPGPGTMVEQCTDEKPTGMRGGAPPFGAALCNVVRSVSRHYASSTGTIGIEVSGNKMEHATRLAKQLEI